MLHYAGEVREGLGRPACHVAQSASKTSNINSSCINRNNTTNSSINCSELHMRCAVTWRSVAHGSKRTACASGVRRVHEAQANMSQQGAPAHTPTAVVLVWQHIGAGQSCVGKRHAHTPPSPPSGGSGTEAPHAATPQHTPTHASAIQFPHCPERMWCMWRM